MDLQKRIRRFFIFISLLIFIIMFALSVYLAVEYKNASFPFLFLICLCLLLAIQIYIVRLNIVSKKIGSSAMELAYTDQVTGARNFTKFKLDVEALFQKNPKGHYVIFYSDIRNFKYINDVYGFEAGNKILRRYSDLLGAEQKLVFARINADNFVSIEAYSNDNVQTIIDNCIARIERVCNVSGIIPNMPSILISVGAYCTMGDNVSLSIDAMIDRARLAQDKIKKRREAGCMVYTEELRETMLAEQDMENRMREALQNGEFVVYLQPKFDILNNRAAAAEALARWVDPQRGLISPSSFIPLFERNGFIRQLDLYMFEQVCIYIRKWLDAGCEVLTFFKSHGFRSSIDDFGAGYSSLNLLKKLPADILKLDKLFFNESEYQGREKVIIKHIISMAKDLSMQTVAEGVEHWEQVAFLQSVQCEMVQGFVFDRPQPAEEFERKYIMKTEQQPSVCTPVS